MDDSVRRVQDFAVLFHERSEISEARVVRLQEVKLALRCLNRIHLISQSLGELLEELLSVQRNVLRGLLDDGVLYVADLRPLELELVGKRLLDDFVLLVFE